MTLTLVKGACMTKSIFTSRTFWVAVVQAVLGVLVAAITVDPNLQRLGWITIVKSLLDVMLRLGTDTAVGVGRD